MEKLVRLYQTIRQLEARPYYFGLGFIQLKINDSERFHFYHPELAPIINIEEEIHNHRYDFVSEVLVGEMINKIYHFTPNEIGLYKKEYETCNPNIVLNTEDKIITKGDINLFMNMKIQKGEKYFMDHRTFHTLSTEVCMTKLTRTSYLQKYAEVIRSIEAEKICPFSLELSENECWNIIEKVMFNNK